MYLIRGTLVAQVALCHLFEINTSLVVAIDHDQEVTYGLSTDTLFNVI